ncbi:MAG TPA: ABC transporter permease [Acidimicrobiia bacterium]
MTVTLEPSRLHPADVGRTASVGLRSRMTRAVLSALGIAIGIASMVAVLGLSDSSKSELLATLDRLGTNLITVQAGQGIGRGAGELPETAAAMIARIGPVEETAAVVNVDANVYRTDLIPSDRTNGLSVQAVDLTLLDTLAGTMAQGKWFDQAAAAYPTTVLGAVAAERLGVSGLPARVWLGDQWFTVIGTLDTFELSPDLDRAALVGMGAAENHLDSDVVPSVIHVRSDPDHTDDVMGVLAATANPINPEEIEVSRPTDALEAKEAANDTFTALFLGLGAVALLVGGVGIANVMVISVLERRAEIGLRRALGATKGHVAVQFLGEALLLSVIGGLAGVAIGYGVTAGWSAYRGWDVLVPRIALLGGFGAALIIGTLAGFYPATRAARMSPTEALRSA